ncbi:MAG: hypothetical protein V1721_07990 [Pseudomonadota bacterium]
MKSQVFTSFNYAANKIVDTDECFQKAIALYKKELSIGDKLFLGFVDMPLSVMAGVALGVKGWFNKEVREGLYVAKNSKKIYASGAHKQKVRDFTSRFIPLNRLNKGYQDRIDRLDEKAFEQSKNYSEDPVIMRRLKSL